MNSCWKKLSLCARQEVDRDNQTTQKLVSSNKTNQQTNGKKKKKTWNSLKRYLGTHLKPLVYTVEKDWLKSTPNDRP